jgi:hypothetical protein
MLAALLLAAGSSIVAAAPIQSAESAAAKAAAAPTRKISGRALDADGAPVAGAMVLLTRHDPNPLHRATVLARAQSRADGRFELAPLESDLKKPTDDSTPEFQIWIWKSGLAVASATVFGEPSEPSYSIWMEKDSPILTRLEKPHGAPCAEATVTPIVTHSAPPSVLAIPEPIQEKLKAHSGCDGLVPIAGFNGLLGGITIVKAGLGIQTLALSREAPLPSTIRLRKPHRIEGRIVLPGREGFDFSTSSLVLRSNEQIAGSESDCCRTWGISWHDRHSVRMDREGRFTMSDFPVRRYCEFALATHESDANLVLLHGSSSINNTSPIEVNRGTIHLLSFPPAVVGILGDFHPIKLAIVADKGVRVSGIVRDSQTKRAIPYVRVALSDFRKNFDSLTSHGDYVVAHEVTDEKGAFWIFVPPGCVCRTTCEIPADYLGPQGEAIVEVRIPSGVERYEMPPIDLVRAATIAGMVVDDKGRPLSNVRVRGDWRPIASKPAKGQPADICRWTTTDAGGRFEFERVDAGAQVTLLPLRSGIALAEPIKVVAGDGQEIPLHATKCECVALSGRILGTDHKPIGGAHLIVEVRDSHDPRGAIRTVANADGSFQTPAHFPKHLTYRLTVRSLLKDVASSDWMSPTASGNRFADLVVDRGKLKLTSKLPRDEIVAVVNGQPILAGVPLDRAFREPLPPNGMKLSCALADLETGRMTELKYRELQDLAIRKFLGSQIKTRLHSEAVLLTLDEKQKESVEHSLEEMWTNYIEQLKKQMSVDSDKKVEQKLKDQGTSLVSLRQEFRVVVLGREYLRQVGKSDPDRKAILAHYQNHRTASVRPERVGWQLLEVAFEKIGTKQEESLANSEKEKAEPNALARESSPWRLREPLKFFADQIAHTEKSSTDPDKPKNTHDASLIASVSTRSRKQARRLIDEAAAQLGKGVPFETVAKKLSEGPQADRGGWQRPVNPDNLADEKTALALRKLAEGETSGVIETDDSFRIVRLVSRTPAGPHSFDEVAQSIREVLQSEFKKRALKAVYAQSSIESPYIPDVPAFLQEPVPTEGNPDCH